MSDSEHKPTDEELEEIHFNSVLTAFEQYRSYSLSANSRRLKDFYKLPQDHQKLLNELGWRNKIDLVDERIEANAKFLTSIVDYPQIFEESDDDYEDGHSHHGHSHDHSHSHDHAHSHDHGHPHSHSHGDPSSNPSEDDEGSEDEEDHEPHPYDSLNQHSHSHDEHAHDHGHSHDHDHDHGHSHSVPAPTLSKKVKKNRVSDNDMDKLRSTLKQFVRDWSVEGKAERDASYLPILQALENHYANVSQEDRANLKVLVPGTGLARLPYEVINRGFTCQGNEFSHYMLLSSYFILNRTTEINQHTIYPYIHSFSNLRSSEALLREVKIPDVLPSDLPKGPTFSLVAGDFEEIYGQLGEDDERESQQGKWDAVLTCFFIDTAKNIVNYLKIIHDLLTPGGVWINLGPLLWHFENSGGSSDTSIELGLDEVRALAERIGFEFSNERTIDTTYTGVDDAMLSYVYRSAFWTATKKQK